jgi:hypothetical protein
MTDVVDNKLARLSVAKISSLGIMESTQEEEHYGRVGSVPCSQTLDEDEKGCLSQRRLVFVPPMC